MSSSHFLEQLERSSLKKQLKKEKIHIIFKNNSYKSIKSKFWMTFRWTTSGSLNIIGFFWRLLERLVGGTILGQNKARQCRSHWQLQNIDWWAFGWRTIFCTQPRPGWFGALLAILNGTLLSGGPQKACLWASVSQKLKKLSKSC